MQGQHHYQPELFSQIDYENLIPPGHLLRRIDKVLDLSFLRELTAPLYANEKGRPSIDPEIFVRMILLEYLYNMNSDRQLCEEIGYNLAYRWFCKLSLTDKVPDHSSITRIRDRLGEKTYEIIFNRVVEQCRARGLIKLDQVMMDGSTVRANASIYSMKEREDEKPKDDHDDPQSGSGNIYSSDGLSSNDFRQRNIEGKKISSKTHVSVSDPEATLCGKAFEAKSLAYKTHHAIDASSRVIIDCHVTTGTVSEIRVAIERVDFIEQHLGLKIKELVADRGYGSAENLADLRDRNIESNIPLWSSSSGKTFFKEVASGFKTDVKSKTATCPEGHEMTVSSIDHVGQRTIFTLPRKICLACAKAKTCLTPFQYDHASKRFAVPDRHEMFTITAKKQEEPGFKKKLWERMWKMEGIFAEAKNFHGLRRARYRGRAKVQIQVYMISTVQNLKRLAGSALASFYEFLFEFVFCSAEVRNPVFCQ
jgi:transposase